MKTLIFILSALVLTGTSSWAEKGRGGGDPVSMGLKPYTDQQQLSEAVDILMGQISKSLYEKTFINSFKSDLDLLVSTNNFWIAPVESLTPDEYFDKMLSAGAVTDFKEAGAIVFAERVLAYSAAELARVIAQEIPHHILYSHLTLDEGFVNAIGISLAQGTYDQLLDARLSSNILATSYEGYKCNKLGKRAERKFKYSANFQYFIWKNYIRNILPNPDSAFVFYDYGSTAEQFNNLPGIMAYGPYRDILNSNPHLTISNTKKCVPKNSLLKRNGQIAVSGPGQNFSQYIFDTLLPCMCGQ